MSHVRSGRPASGVAEYRFSSQAHTEDMSQQSIGTGQSSAYVARGSYRTNITALGVRPGVLRTTAGMPVDRLTFVADNGESLLDAAIDELHSVGLAEMNGTLEVWQGDKRHRISLAPGGPLVGNVVGEFQPTSVAMQWHDYLQPRVGVPPPGVRVKKPLSRGANIGIGVVLALIIIVVVIAAVILVG